jgi:hypothetical protein
VTEFSRLDFYSFFSLFPFFLGNRSSFTSSGLHIPTKHGLHHLPSFARFTSSCEFKGKNKLKRRQVIYIYAGGFVLASECLLA